MPWKVLQKLLVANIMPGLEEGNLSISSSYGTKIIHPRVGKFRHFARFNCRIPDLSHSAASVTVR